MSRIAILVMSCLLFAGCTAGSGSGGEPNAEASSAQTSSPDASPPTATSKPAGPDCQAIWKPGQLLPKDYTSCTVDGQEGAQEVIACKDGSSLVIYRDELYAVTGTPVIEPDVAPLQDTAEYGEAYSNCTGE